MCGKFSKFKVLTRIFFIPVSSFFTFNLFFMFCTIKKVVSNSMLYQPCISKITIKQRRFIQFLLHQIHIESLATLRTSSFDYPMLVNLVVDISNSQFSP